MQSTASRSTGIGAGVRKYDVLSAVALAGLHGQSMPSQRALRLIALITMRYNWASDSLAIGHDELTRLWKVSKRTVIREIDALRQVGILVVLRAGRKGRVSLYRLDVHALRAASASVLEASAPDVAGRLEGPLPVTSSHGHASAGAPSVRCLPDDAWSRTLAGLSNTVSASARARWLEPCEAVVDGCVLRVMTDSSFRAAYVARTFGDAIERAAKAQGFDRIEIVETKGNEFG